MLVNLLLSKNLTVHEVWPLVGRQLHLPIKIVSKYYKKKTSLGLIELTCAVVYVIIRLRTGIILYTKQENSTSIYIYTTNLHEIKDPSKKVSSKVRGIKEILRKH